MALPSPALLGTRKSALALTQSREVIRRITSQHTSAAIEIVTADILADTDKQSSFQELSKQTGGSDVGKSLWTNELEADLVAGKVHLLVHSLKDMPTTLPAGCALAAITEREDTSDAVIMKAGSTYTDISQLPAGSVVGSSSSRRKALIKKNWPHLEVEECRGNLDTRLAKLDAPDSKFSCILLATSGLSRLNLAHRITHRLTPDVFPYAVGQGALGVEIRDNSPEMTELVLAADHKLSRWRCMAERAMLRSLQGGCSSPIGVFTAWENPEGEMSKDNKLKLGGTVVHVDGSKHVSADTLAVVESDKDAEQLGYDVAKMLMDKGAADLLVKHA